jgi:peptidyl-prolyl cis-trans isomerase C
MLNVKCKIKFLLILLALFALLTLSVSPPHASDKIVATVNGAPITEAEVERQIERILPQSLYHGNITEEKRLKYREKAIEELILRELLYQEAKEKGVKVNRSKVKEVLEFYKKQYGSEDKLVEAIKRIHLDIEGLKKEIEKDLVVAEFKRVYIEGKSKVSEAELIEYYEKNRENFREPDKVKLREIFIAVPYDADYETIEKKKVKAEAVLKKAKAGEDFAELAWKYSEDPYAVKGGDIGYIHSGRLAPELEKTAFKLKPGEVSGLIEVKAGYFIIKVEEIIPSKLLDFDEIKDKLRKDLENRRKKEIRQELIKRLKEKAVIKKVQAGQEG